MSANDAQIDYWNGPGGARWVAEQDTLEQLVAPFGAAALAALGAQPGERVLDVGCGCGATTLELARMVGPSGAVTGVDVSAPMLAVARGRAKPAGATIHFLEADASALPVPSPLVDAIFSRFGVMFFAEPVVAMAALRAQGRPGAALAFVCWRAPADNPWAMAPLMAVRALLPPQPPADPLAPGPFAFADAGRLNTILEDAGWRDVALAPFEAPMRLGATLAEAAEAVLKMGPAAALLREAGEGLEVAAHAAVAEALAPFKGPEGVSPPGAVWVVTARA